MCIDREKVDAMFRSASSFNSCRGDDTADSSSSSAYYRAEEGEELEDLPISSPRLASPPPPPETTSLARQPTTRAACSDMEDGPPASERLKPQPFRRKDPALHFQACVRGDLRELAKWVRSGGDPNSRDEEGWALLHHATVGDGVGGGGGDGDGVWVVSLRETWALAGAEGTWRHY